MIAVDLTALLGNAAGVEPKPNTPFALAALSIRRY